MLARMAQCFYRRFLAPRVEAWFFCDLVRKTENFSHVTWLGQPVWQNVLDLWIMQETIAEVKPSLLIECGTNRGGSALFFAHLFDLLGHGDVITIDVQKMHDLSHPRITFLLGSSLAPQIVAAVQARVAQTQGPILVTLDSNHAEEHVRQELACYAPLVTPGSYCLVQDGIIDTLPMFAAGRPGPLAAIEDFMKTATDFEVDDERARKFLISHHPRGWLRRKVAKRTSDGILAPSLAHPANK